MFPSGPLQYKEVLHLCRWYTHTLTSVPDNSLTHNTWTHTDPRNTCTNSIFTPAPLPHHSFTHSNFTHDSISHTPLLHTFTHTPFTNNTFTRNSFAHLTSICISAHRSSTISCLFPAFPIPSSPFFGYLLEEVDVGLSGPLITMSWCFLTSSNNALESIQYSIEHAWIPWNAEGGVFDVLHLFHWAWIPQWTPPHRHDASTQFVPNAVYRTIPGLKNSKAWPSFEELQIAATNISILHVDAEVEEKSSSPDARPWVIWVIWFYFRCNDLCAAGLMEYFWLSVACQFCLHCHVWNTLAGSWKTWLQWLQRLQIEWNTETLDEEKLNGANCVRLKISRHWWSYSLLSSTSPAVSKLEAFANPKMLTSLGVAWWD